MTLAILGGTPAFAEPVHVGRPNIGDRAAFMQRVEATLDRQWLTNDGPNVRELETRLAALLNVEHCIAMSNATAALEALARALALTGEVVVPAFTFIATAHAFSWLGLTPVFADVDADTHMLDPRALDDVINARTSALAPVHLWGGGCDVDGLTHVANARGIPIIFDAAHALASTIGGRAIGGFGNAEVFSFHATKFFNTFEGGAVTTNDDALARELRLMRNFGFRGYDDVASIGTNAKMNEISAAMGLTSLDGIEALMELNRKRFEQHAAALSDLPGIRVVRPARAERSNYQYFVIEVSERAGLTRDQLLATLWSENVRARRYFYPGCHRAAPYAALPTKPLPVTERLAREVLILPTGGSVSEADVDKIAVLVRTALQTADELTARVPREIPPGGLRA